MKCRLVGQCEAVLAIYSHGALVRFHYNACKNDFVFVSVIELFYLFVSLFVLHLVRVQLPFASPLPFMLYTLHV